MTAPSAVQSVPATRLVAPTTVTVLVTEWPEFAELDLADVASRMRGTLLVDGRNFLDPEAVRSAGLLYEGIGRPSQNGG